MNNEDFELSFLVVDDSNISRKWLIEAIPEAIRKRSKITEASNGQEAVDFYEKDKFSVVFLDITMPIMDGFGALENILKIDKDAIVVMVSADRQKSTKSKVLELGARNILGKPVDKDELRQVLLELMQ